MAGKWKIFRWQTFMSFQAAEKNAQTIFRWKMETIFWGKMEIFQTPPWRLWWCTQATLKMHQTTGFLKHLAHFAPEVCFLLGVLASSLEYFRKRRLMHNGSLLWNIPPHLLWTPPPFPSPRTRETRKDIKNVHHVNKRTLGTFKE